MHAATAGQVDSACVRALDYALHSCQLTVTVTAIATNAVDRINCVRCIFTNVGMESAL